MKKILYAVSSGKYSDYSVNAIFDDKSLAEKFIAMFSGGDYRIEEYELNPFLPVINSGKSPFSVIMRRDGTIESCDKEDSIFMLDSGDIPYCFRDDDTVFYRVFAKDNEHAIKIVNEKRTQFLASNMWGKNQ